ncbi:MAG: L-type lectin-domain containing protein [Verrucomicrobiota bacterium]
MEYPNFASPTGLIFQAEAKLQNDFVRLTPSHTDHRGRVGGLWFQTKQSILGGFDTMFQLRITNKTGRGADGIVFVLQDKATPSLGVSGHHMGFVRGGNAVAIKFDNYHYHRNYIKYDEIQITSCIASEMEPRGGSSLGTITGPELFSDGKIHAIRIRYIPGRMEIFLDDLKKPLLVAAFKLEEVVPFKKGEAWVGFTASTGADSQNQDILSWTFNTLDGSSVNPEPAQDSLATLRPGNPESVRANANRTTDSPVNSTPPNGVVAPTAVVSIQPQVVGIPVVDGTVGQPRLQLPETIRLSHDVFASSDLVNWTLVTNLNFYFSEPVATNYDRRFYQFRER